VSICVSFGNGAIEAPCGEVTSSYAITPLPFEQRTYQAKESLLRVSVYISVSPFISDKNKHEVSDQMYNCPHNTYTQMVESGHADVLVLLNTLFNV